MGSTGDPPVPVGDPPTGRARRFLSIGAPLLVPGSVPVPPGESPGGTGRWPTAIELGIGPSSVCRPLPARNEGGEGWGGGKSNKNAAPLPGPLLLLRRKRGRKARSLPLIQCQWADAPGRHSWVRVASETRNRRLVVLPMAAVVAGSIEDGSSQR